MCSTIAILVSLFNLQVRAKHTVASKGFTDEVVEMLSGTLFHHANKVWPLHGTTATQKFAKTLSRTREAPLATPRQQTKFEFPQMPARGGPSRSLRALGHTSLRTMSAPASSLNPGTTATLPKTETGISTLLQSHPEADGRGILLAVLDTGCDLAAAGLLTTSDGLPKYIDFIDCTGDGDVDTSKIVTRDSDGAVTGISGRQLRLGSWADEADELRLGAVRLYDLLPHSVLTRVQRERKVAFSVKQHVAVTAAQRQLAAIPSGVAHSARRKDAEAKLAELKKMMDGYIDAGPLLDVVLFRVGSDASTKWRAVIGGTPADADIEADVVDLTAATPMAPYRETRQVGDLGYGTALSYAVQVYDGGDTTSLVVDAGSHGTHVAGIAAAHFPETPERNGVAPGAQVLACKIGDGRLRSAETGTGLVRALIAAKAAGCDVINLSFGEPFWQVDYGRISQTFTDAVRKWRMTVFTSAGNDGPALSSLGAPGCLSALITVGAYISPSMMSDQYSMLEPASVVGQEPNAKPIAPTSYSFSSRGPTPDGWLPTLCAPGGAIAPVPRHTLQGKAQYHGTSMSSPNACGVAACVLSALRQNGIRVGPIELRRALENTAVPVDISDPFAQGFGLINAPAAVAYATAHHGKLGQDIEFSVHVPSRGNARGIYLRDATELAGPLTFGVHVQPLFEHASVRTATEMEEILGVELDMKLMSDASWVHTPASMVLTSGLERGGQSFAVRLDISGLPSGAHFARVQAVDAADPARGPLFTLPVSVIVPHVVAPVQATNLFTHSLPMADEDSQAVKLNVTLTAGAPFRRFLVAPGNAEWAVVRLLAQSLPQGPHNVILHAVPSARGDVPNTALQVKRMLALREHSNEVVMVPVKGGSTLEICMQLSWLNNPNPVEFEALVEFHSYGMRGGAVASDRPLRIGAADAYARLEIASPLRTERLSPKAELTSVERALRPAKYSISAASSELDVLPPSDAERTAAGDRAVGTQIHQMVLTYSFEVQPGDKDETQSVVPRVASLHEQLYDSPLDSMIWRLESADTGSDTTGAILGYGGAIHDAAPIKLRKGKYKIMLLLRHPAPSQLEALKDLPLLLMMNLATPVECKVYNDRGAASALGHGEGMKPVGDSWLRRGGHRNIYVAAPTTALPSWVSPGDILTGSLLVDKGAAIVSKVPLTYATPPHPAKKDDGTSTASDDSTDSAAGGDDAEANAKAKDAEELDKAVLDAKLARLAAMRKSNASVERYEALSTAMYTANRSHLPLLLEILAWQRRSAPAANASEASVAAKRASEIGNAADALFGPDGPIDKTGLAQYWGVAQEDSSDASTAAKKKKKEMEEQRKALRLALFAKADALAPSKLVITEAPPSDTDPSPFIEAVREMKQWVTKPEDLEEGERDGLALTLCKYDLALSRPASALAVLHARLKARPSKQILSECVELYKLLGWSHWAKNAEERLERDYPRAKIPL